MKKNISLLCFLSFLLIGNIALWAGTWSTSIDTQLDSKVLSQASAEVQSIEVKFCENDSKAKQYIVTAGKAQDICLEISNSVHKAILVSMDFVDGTLTNDQRKNRACLDSNQTQNFGQYISGSEHSFVVPAEGGIIKHVTLTYPKGEKGSFLGCLVYYTKGVSLGWTSDFNILVRRAKFIDITLKESFRSLYQREIMAIIAVIVLLLALKYGKVYIMVKKSKK